MTPGQDPAASRGEDPELAGDPSAFEPAGRYHWRVLSVTGLGALLTSVNTSTLSVALPVVARHFDASASEASWMLLSYMLVNTVLILVFGRLADILGRRRLYLGGLALLTLACLASGLAPDAPTLIGLRVLQAVGGAAVITNTAPLLTDAFPRRLLSTGLGLNTMIVSTAQVIGPVVGGLFASTLGWRWVFWFNVPIGVVALIWSAVTLRRLPGRGSHEPFDLVGAALSLLVVGTLVVALSEGGSIGWTSTPVLAAGCCFVLATPAFVAVQLRRQHPLVDLGLFGERARAMAYLASFLNSVGRFAVVVLVALYIQAVRDTDPFHASLQVLTVAIGMIVGAPIAGRLATRFTARVVSSSGMVLTTAGLASLAGLIHPGTPWPVYAVTMAAVGLGYGTFLPPNTSSIMSSVPPARRGIANGMRSMLQNAGMVVSTALGLAIVTSPLPAQAKAAAYAGELTRLPGSLLGVFTGAYRVALAVLAALVAAGLVASLLRSPGVRSSRTGAPVGRWRRPRWARPRHR